MNGEKLYRYIYNLLPFPSSPLFNPKTKKGTYLVVVHVDVIFIDFYFLTFICRNKECLEFPSPHKDSK